MVNNVVRLAAPHYFPFLYVFQEAAARAYSRVYPVSSRVNAPHTGSSSNAVSQKSFYPTSHPRCLKSFSPERFSSNLFAPCRFLRHYSSRAQAEPAPLLPAMNDPPSCRSKRNVKKRSFLIHKIERNELSLGVPVQTTTTALKDYNNPPSISSETCNFANSAVTIPSIQNHEDPLSKRLLHLYMSSPHTSVQSLVSYHSMFPNLQFSRTYNFLLRQAIRHSAFGTAHALLKSMRASRVPEDQTTCKLYVRLLVREGRWPDAYNFVTNLPKNRPRAPFISDSVPVPIWAELLGTAKRRAFGGLSRTRDPGMNTLPRYHHVIGQLLKLGVSSTDTPPPQVVYGSVAALLRMQEREAARRVTTPFLSMDPKGLGLRLVHLHMAPEPKRRGLRTFYRALKDLQGFCVSCPEFKPNSTTLFLLLGHLKGTRRCGITGHKLSRWFSRRWGHSVVSPRVERRLLALAVEEKRVDLIKEWMTCVKTRRKIWWAWSLEREVVDGGLVKQRSTTRNPDERLAKAGTEGILVDRVLRRASRVLFKAKRRVYVATGTP
ncbi:hypothetical protein F5148DRAFT_646682 [Russula earlei]|uniref:Uncharacterized protein n=1 Tax=Russula earlei TaxID=71964 RepID=A0ACC0UMS3_9AGAM|nr:hypothetical protein F5148DRAFT_646682 [Russula earlei]